MTSGGSIESALAKISREYLECNICFNRFKQPKLLDCLHSFCQKCLQVLMREGNSTKLSCPLCRQETKLEGKDVTDLRNNFTFSALVDEFHLQEQLLKCQESEIICQSCDENHPAVARCMDCDHFICKECQQAHEGTVVVESHKVYTLAQLRSGETAYKTGRRREVPKCDEHSDQKLSVYCNTCKYMLCVQCVALDHDYNNHYIIGLPEALDECKQEVGELVARVEKKKKAMNIAIDETKTYHEKLNSMFADTNKKITLKADTETKKKLQEELLKIYQDRGNTIDFVQSANSKEVTRAEQKLHEVNQLMAQSSCYEILDLKKKLKGNLMELTEKQPELLHDRLSSMDFEEGELSPGRLVLIDDPQMRSPDVQWELMTEFKTFGTLGSNAQTHFDRVVDAAVFSNNDIVVVNGKELLTCTMSTQAASHFMAHGQQITSLTCPTRVAVNNDDQLIVLDDTRVIILDREYHLLLKIETIEESESYRVGPSCIAVADNNIMAIGYSFGQISLHNPDGSLFRTLDRFPGRSDNFLTIYKQHLIYRSGTHLFFVDYDDSEVLKVDISSNLDDFRHEWPGDVCCDSDGSMYVSCRRGYGGGSIIHFSPDGTYLGHVMKDDSSCEYQFFPRGITLTSAGHIVVAAGKSVRIYRRL